MGEEALQFALQLVCMLRHERIAAEIDLSGKKVQHGLQLASQANAEFAIVIGDEELKTKTIKLKHMATREAIDSRLNDLVAKLKDMVKSHV